MKCTFGEGTSNLIIAARGIKLHGAEKANIKDKTITPFKNCKGGKCVPNFVSDWQKTTEAQVANKPALLDVSTIMCARGGIVSIDDPGQKQITTAATKQKQIVDSKREYDCEYTSLVNICTAINSKFMQTDLKKRCVEYRKAKKRYNELKLQREALITGNKSIVQKSPTEELKKLKKIKYPNSLEKARIAMLENIINTNMKKNSDKLAKIDKEIAIQKSKSSVKTHDILVMQIKYTSILAGLTAINLSKAKKDIKGLHKKYGGISCDTEKSKFYNVSVLGTIVEGYLLEAADIANVPLTKKQYEQEVADEILKKQEEQGIPYWQRNSKETTDNDYINTKYNIKTNVQEKAEEKYEIAKNIDLGVQLYRDIKKIPTGQDIVKKIREGEKSVVNCPFNVAEKSAREGGEVKNSNNTSSTTSSKNQAPSTKQSGAANTQKSEAKENTGKSNERCPVNGKCEIDCSDTWDKYTNERIKKLDPRIRCIVKTIINRAEKELGLQVRVSQGLRTIEEQNALYAKGPSVTKAKGGQSYHNYGLAFDMVLIINKKAYWRENEFRKVAEIAREYNGEWGGNWSSKSKDFPHIQFTFGKTWKDYKSEYISRGNKLGYEFE